MVAYDGIAADRGTRRLSALAVLALLIAILTGIAQIAGVVAFRFGLPDPETAFTWGFRNVMFYAPYGYAAAAVLALVGLGAVMPGGVRRGLSSAIVALIISGGMLYFIFGYWYDLKTNPIINDISTDMANPPKLMKVLSDRTSPVINSPDYGGAEVAEMQRCAYPGIQTLQSRLSAQETYKLAVDAAQVMDWNPIYEDPENLRIEATDTSLLYAFKDDIVIRISQFGSGSRVDMRSVSRYGKADFGVNAGRIEAFLAELSRSMPK